VLSELKLESSYVIAKKRFDAAARDKDLGGAAVVGAAYFQSLGVWGMEVTRVYAKAAVCRSFWANRLRQQQKRKKSWALERRKRVERPTGRSQFVARCRMEVEWRKVTKRFCFRKRDSTLSIKNPIS
jgi:hypothetical protein